MTPRRGILWAIFGVAVGVVGCTHSGTELDLKDYASPADQEAIAAFHDQEAARLSRQARESADRVRLYEQLFGPESDWVAGARLLAQSYEFAAQEQERSAQSHRDVLQRVRP